MKERQFFAPLPHPDDKRPKGHLGEHELPTEDVEGRLALLVRTEAFARERNPLYAIEAFLLAYEQRLYPPACVVDFLANAFKRWHEAQGRLPLEVALGLRRKGQGRRDSVFEKALHEERDEMLALDCARLVALGATISEGAVAVAERLKATKDWNKSGFTLRPLDDYQIARRYRALSPTMKRDATEQVRKWDEPSVQQYLALFPPLYLPPALKNRGKKKPFSRR